MRAGTVIIWAGVALMLLGVLIRYLPGGWFSWFGHLPGDVRVEGERTRVFAPIASMLLVSVVASLLFRLISRIIRGE